MRYSVFKRSMNRGFSLVEMAVVLAIISLLMAGLLPMISGQVDQQHRTETRRQLDEIRAALVGFAATQTPPRLPCPANPTKATGTTGAGIEDCTIAPVAGVMTGVLPWVTLGTSETDAWGRRFTYAVPASSVGSFTAGFTLASSSPINALALAGGSAIASGVPAVIVSHGVNGAGAYLPTGTQLPVSTNTDEADNSNGGNTFVSHEESPTYDDLVVWISPNTLFNRMVSAGKLP